MWRRIVDPGAAGSKDQSSNEPLWRVSASFHLRQPPGRDREIIARDDGAGDLFLHYSAIMVTGFKAMQEGERVSFEVSQGQKGPQAERVRSLERHEDPQAS